MKRPGCWTSTSVRWLVIMKKSAFAFCLVLSTIRRLSHSGRDGLGVTPWYGLRSVNVDWSMTCMSPAQSGGGIAGSNSSPRSTLTSSSRTGRKRQPVPPVAPCGPLMYLRPDALSGLHGRGSLGSFGMTACVTYVPATSGCGSPPSPQTVSPLAYDRRWGYASACSCGSVSVIGPQVRWMSASAAWAE